MQAIIELIGIGLIAPYLELIFNFEQSVDRVAWFVEYFNLPINQKLLIQYTSYLLLFIFSVKLLVAILLNYVIVNFVQNRRLLLAMRLLDSYQSMPYSEYKHKNSSEYIYRIQVLSYEYANVVLAPMLRVIGDLTVGLGLIIMLVIYNPSVFIMVCMAFVMIIMGYDYLTNSTVKSAGAECNLSSEKMIKHTKEAMTGFKEIRVLGSEAYFKSRLQNAIQEFIKNMTKVQLLTLVPKLLIEWIFIVMLVLLVLSDFRSYELSNYLLTTLGLFGIAAIRLLPMFNQMASMLLSIRASKNTVDILYKDCNTHKRDESTASSGQKVDFRSLELKGVSFGYSNSTRLILDDVNLTITKGEMIGLVGPSGSGKSTLLDIIMGLTLPSEGRVLLNTKELKTRTD